MKIRKPILCALLSVFCLAAIALPAAPAQASDAYITLTPSSGPPGQAVYVEGHGFLAGDPDIYVLFDGELLAGNITADTYGNWAKGIYVPLKPPGVHNVTAYGTNTTAVGGLFEIKARLIISSTAGGSVTSPGEGTFACDEGAVVNLTAIPASGYVFVCWSGDVGTIANVNGASTTITMNDHYSITASFYLPPPAPSYLFYDCSTIPEESPAGGWQVLEPWTQNSEWHSDGDLLFIDANDAYPVTGNAGFYRIEDSLVVAKRFEIEVGARLLSYDERYLIPQMFLVFAASDGVKDAIVWSGPWPDKGQIAVNNIYGSIYCSAENVTDWFSFNTYRLVVDKSNEDPDLHVAQVYVNDNLVLNVSYSQLLGSIDVPELPEVPIFGFGGAGSETEWDYVSCAMGGPLLVSVSPDQVPQPSDVQYIPLEDIPLRDIPLRDIPLRDIPLRDISLDSTPLRDIALEDIPLRDIGGIDWVERLQGTSFEGTPLRDIKLGDLLLAGIPVDDITLEDVFLAMLLTCDNITINGTPLRDIVLAGTPLQDIPLRDIPLRDIILAGTPLRDIPLRDIPLRDITLLNIILGTPLRDIPVSNITLEDLVLAGIPLIYTDFASTPLRDIPLEDIDIYGVPLQEILAGTPLRDIPLRDMSFWELSLSSIAVQNVTVNGTPLHDVPLEDIQLQDISWEALLMGTPLEGIPLRDISLGDLALAAAPLRDITIDGTPLRDITLEGTYLHDYLMGIALEDILLQDIRIEGTPLEDIPLEDIPLRHISWEALLEGTSLEGTPLRDIRITAILEAGISLEGITLLDIVLGQVPLRDITLWELLLAILPLRDIPWESVPLRDIPVQDIFSDQNVVTYTITLPNYSDTDMEGVEITHTLPQDFQYQPGSSNVSIGIGQNTTYNTTYPAADPVISGQDLSWGPFAVPSGETLTLVFDAIAAISLGTYYSSVEASCNSTHDIIPALDAAPVTVVDTFEVNDSCEQAVEISEDRLYISYVSTDTDLDWYKFAVPEEGSMVTVYLSHLPDDYDLVLCADATMVDVAPQDIPLQDAPLRDIPLRDIPLRDIPMLDIPLDDVALQDIPLRDIPLDTLRDISVERGTTDEITGDRVVNEEGYYYIMVSGYNGAHGDEPYVLRISVKAPLPIEPYERDLPEAGDAGMVYEPFTTDTETIIVINEQRLVQYYGDEAIHGSNSSAGLRSELEDFANLSNVKGMIFPVDSDPSVVAAYAAWDANAADPQAANDVTAAIRIVLRAAILLHADIKHVVIVGSDEIVPFHRVPDETCRQNESTYAAEAHLIQPSALYASLVHGYIMTDDYYVDMAPVPWMGRELYVPDYAIGRLVETPAEIIGMLDEFDASGGELIIETALVTGYSFLTDAGIAIKNTLLGKGINATDIDVLISENWTGSALQSILAGNSSPDISSINAHCNHYGIGPPIGSPLYSYQISLQEDGKLIFSSGCHAGLNVDDTVSTAGNWSLDLPQAFAQEAAWYIGNTGYGWGDSDIVALSEELMLRVAEALSSENETSVPVGRALMDAKQNYFLSMGSYGPFDEKIMIESTLYGLPMYMIDPDVPTNPGEELVDPDLTMTVDQYDDFSMVNSLNDTSSLVRIHAGDGDYFVADGESQFVPYRPIQPKTSMRIELPNTVAHGALFTGGTYEYLPGFNPVIARPIWDTSEYEPQFINDAWYPCKQQTIMSLQTPGGVKQRLVVIPGQFITTSADTEVIGLERLYSSMDYDVYYSASTDFSPPIIWRVGVNVADSTAHFDVRADDFMGTAKKAEKVVVTWTYTTGGNTWESMDLSYNSSSEEWIGDLPGLTGRIDFMVQAVDAAGNVGVSMSKGLFTTQNTAPAILEIDAPIDPVMVGGAVNGSAMFIDQQGDTHTAIWDWGDGLLSDGSVVEPGIGPGSVSGEHTYSAAGVYTVTLTVSDNRGESVEGTFQYVVTYDPNAGFVTGGGWITSPEGAYTADPSLTGKATFGFVSKYKKGDKVPTGSTEFQFKAGDLNFKSTSYEWMVVAGAKAQYKGTGTINQAGTYRFRLTVIDGNLLAGGEEADKFRIRIWGDDGLVYDNQLSAPDTADPTTVLGGGSIVVHK